LNKAGIDIGLDKKVSKTGDTMTGELKVHQTASEAITVTKDGTTDTFVVWSSGAVVADQVKVVQTTPLNEDNLTSRKYVDDSIAAIPPSSGGETFDGGIINQDLVLKSTLRQIDSFLGTAGQLAYNGQSKFKWGSSKNVSEQELRMDGNKISEVADITLQSESGQAVNLGSMNAAIAAIPPSGGGSGGPSMPGRPFVMRSTGDSSHRIDPGEFFMSTAGNVSWTASLADARFLTFTYEDLDSIVWKMGKSASIIMPTGYIHMMDGDTIIGWWPYDSYDMAWSFADGSNGGGIVVPLKNIVSTSDVSNLTSGKNYRINCPFW
jgi:hypothetical protein